MTVMTMKIKNPRWLRAGAILVYLIGGLAWSMLSRADDEFKPAVVATLATTVLPAPAPVRELSLHLPALKVGGLSGGQVMLITENGAERMNVSALAQRPLRVPSPFPEFCVPR